MYSKNAGFLLGVLCVSLTTVAWGAPVVRVLGQNTQKNNVASTTGAFSIQNPVGSSQIIQTRAATLNKLKTVNIPGNNKSLGISGLDDTSLTNRLSMKPVKIKVKSKPATQPTSSPSGNTPSGDTPSGGGSSSGTTPDPISAGVMEQLDILADKIDTKADIADLSNYYTKDEIDENYYTSAQVDEKLLEIDNDLSEIHTTIQNINTNVSVENIQNLTNQVNQQANQIQDLQNLELNNDTVYDSNTQQRVKVSIVDDFDKSILDGYGEI